MGDKKQLSMLHRRRRTHKEEAIETPMLPMIDIVFLLIIFFVVTTNLDQDKVNESIQLAKSYYIPPEDRYDPRTTIISIAKTGDGKSVVDIAKKIYTWQELGRLLKRIKDRYGNTAPIIIRAEKDLFYKHIDKLSKVMTKSGLYKVRLASEAKGKEEY